LTRINLVCPTTLHHKHLVAEYRELPRIFNQALAAYERGELPNDKRNPLVFKLATGHVRFFYNKLEFLVLRQHLLVAEMKRRGYRPTFDPTTIRARIAHLPPEWRQNYTPTAEEVALSLARIIERTPKP
jgi:hypothetical protein